MILDLKSIFASDNSELQIDYKYDMSGVEVSGAFPLRNPVTAKGRVLNRASVVSLELIIRYTYSSVCDRCGEDCEREYNVSVDKLLAASIEGEDSDTIIVVPDLKLDLDGLIYSEVILDLPTKFLCKEDCKGICPDCGKNLNDGECGCNHREIDPRLAKLAELLEK